MLYLATLIQQLKDTTWFLWVIFLMAWCSNLLLSGLTMRDSRILLTLEQGKLFQIHSFMDPLWMLGSTSQIFRLD